MMRFWVIAWLFGRRDRVRRHRLEVGRAGYDVYLAEGSDAQIDLDNPTARLAAVTEYQFTGLQADTRYTAAVAARSRFGLRSELVMVTFDTDGSGNPDLVPAAPQELRARALAGGDVELTWLDPADGPVVAGYFRLHWDNGTGKVNYSGFFAFMAATGRRQRYRYVHSPSKEGRLRYSVRGLTAGLKSELNTVVAECVADATGPPAMTQTPTLTQL